MLVRSFLPLRLGLTAGKPLQTTRSTWVLRRVYAPEPTPPGRVQRNPEELPNLMKLEVVEIENNKPAGPLKVILLQDVEGIGHQFDVVDVDRKLARLDLLPTRKAVYASPFDLQYYAKIKEEMADELAKRVRIPYEYICVGRDLQALIVPIKVSMDNKWTIDKQIIKTSLRQMGVDMLDDCIHLDDVSISGPNFEIEAKLIRFYVVVSKQYIVPMLGRISHISVDESKQGVCNFMSAIKIAHLALKHRQNRNHKMRIVMFIGSPIDNLDSTELLDKHHFPTCLREGSGSNLLVVPAGSVLTEALISSAVCRGEDGGNAPVVGAGGGFEFGVDPEDDPDLALALRVSMEEERARQAAEAAAAAAASGTAAAEPAGASEQAQNVDVMDMEMGEMTEEQQLEWALRMSMQDSVPAPAAQPQQAPPAEEVMDVSTAQVDNLDELINNPELLRQIIDDLPGGEKKGDEEKPKSEEK
ncbi:ribosomal protein L9 domain protein [Teladorsagia circumcincta]|uniref:Ribosomal protein L9 domain protein n=1 Tax=Teladorsagia circumcincta TaxID=45464 RepID=A0A2G9TWT3_TELCI|nr:ribosomal protein L9 domain protein [Teladorsagia circumcincta]